MRISARNTKNLNKFGISVELIDVQTILPFYDIYGMIGQSVRKTNRILFLDELSRRTTSFYVCISLEQQNIFRYLDVEPVTLTSRDHRGAF